jgi:integrase
MRRGDLLARRWSDVDFDRGTISVRQALQRNGGVRTSGEPSKLQFAEPKSSRARRTIPMPDRVVAALRAQRARQAEERLAAGAQWQDFDLIFTTRRGTPIEPRSLVTAFKRVLKRAALPSTIRLHDARYFAATLLLEQGVHPRTVMEILGHNDISLTLNTYSLVAPSVIREAAKEIDAVLGQSG